MFLFLTAKSYELDRDHQGKDFDLNDPETRTTECINNYIALTILQCKYYKYTDFDCQEEVRESLEGQTLEMLKRTSRLAIKELYTYLRAYGVQVKKQVGSISFAKTIYDILIKETQHIQIEDEIQEMLESDQEFSSKLNLVYQKPQVMPYITIEQSIKQDQSTIRYIKPPQLEQTPSRILPRQLPRDEIPHLLVQLYRQFSSNPHPSLGRGLLSPII